MPKFNVRVAVANCPISDDDLDHLADNPVGWTIRSRSGEYSSGFQLRLSGDAIDEQDASRRARTAVDAWLAANGVAATVAAVGTFRGR